MSQSVQHGPRVVHKFSFKYPKYPNMEMKFLQLSTEFLTVILQKQLYLNNVRNFRVPIIDRRLSTISQHYYKGPFLGKFSSRDSCVEGHGPKELGSNTGVGLLFRLVDSSESSIMTLLNSPSLFHFENVFIIAYI